MELAKKLGLGRTTLPASASRPHPTENDQAQPQTLPALLAKARPKRAVCLNQRGRWGFSGGQAFVGQEYARRREKNPVKNPVFD
jgi:hypothetical protein